MKKAILLLTIFCFWITKSITQTSFSCTYRQYCVWNEMTKEFENCKGYEENSLFSLNKDETMFTHTIESMKSTYYVNSKKYDKIKDVWSYSVTSDVGNKYLYIFDPKNKQIRAVYETVEQTMMVVFSVKAIFNDQKLSDPSQTVESNSSSTDVMTNRIIKAAKTYGNLGAVDRFVDFDFAFGSNRKEFLNLNTFGILYLSSLNKNIDEYPIDRVYFKSKDQEIKLELVFNKQILVEDQNIIKAFGSNRVDYYYMIPYAITQVEGELLIDWNINRKGFHLCSFPTGNKLSFLQKDDIIPTKSINLDYLKIFLAREFNVSSEK